MEYKKLAYKFQREDNVIIWRENEDNYWISDTHCIFKAKTHDDGFCVFRNKWNSYKSSADIPDITIESTMQRNKDKGEWIYSDIELGRFLDINEDKLMPLKPTDLYYRKKVNLVIGLDYINGIDNEYYQYINPDELFQLDKDEPIYCYNKDEEIIGVIMPYIPQTRRYEKMWSDLDRISGIISEERE